MDLVRALEAPDTTFTIQKVRGGRFQLHVPKFGQGSSLDIRARGDGRGGQVMLRIANARGEVNVTFKARTGQPRYPEGFYTMAIKAQMRGQRRVTRAVYRCNPKPQINDAVRRQLVAVAETIQRLHLTKDVAQVKAAGLLVLLAPFKSFGISAKVHMGILAATGKPELWRVVLKCPPFRTSRT